MKKYVRVLIAYMRRDYVSVRPSNCQDRVVAIQYGITYVSYKTLTSTGREVLVDHRDIDIARSCS